MSQPCRPDGDMNNSNLMLSRYSIGVGDRFGHQAKAQLQACVRALRDGVEVTPVWNKSNREHTIIHSEPLSVRQAADAAVGALAWNQPYYCDADHITLETVDRFLTPCDFYTIDVADVIGQPAPAASMDEFVKHHPELVGHLQFDGVDEPMEITHEQLRATAAQFLGAGHKAEGIYRKI